MASENTSGAENQQGRLEEKGNFKEAIEVVLKEEYQWAKDKLSLSQMISKNPKTASKLAALNSEERDKAVLDTIERITSSLEETTGFDLKIGRDSEKDME